MTFHSAHLQDQFVLTLLKFPRTGYFIDIGSGGPKVANNTYAMETLGWDGICFEMQKHDYSCRRCKFYNIDATTANFAEIFANENVPEIIDYLSIDIDENSLKALEHLPNNKYKVITIEHDAYRFGDTLRTPQREILTSRGYHLLAGNVSHNQDGLEFEDWWIHPDLVDCKHQFNKMSNQEIMHMI